MVSPDRTVSSLLPVLGTRVCSPKVPMLGTRVCSPKMSRSYERACSIDLNHERFGGNLCLFSRGLNHPSPLHPPS